MLRPGLAAVLLAAVLALLPSATPAAQERVVADLVIWVVPPVSEGHCLALEAGELEVTIQAVGAGPRYPVEFGFAGYRGSDTPSALSLDAAPWPSAATVPLAGGLYCYALWNRHPVPEDAGAAITTGYGQDVALRMIWRPASPR